MKTKKAIAAVGALVGALVALAGYLLGWGPEVNAMVLAIVGSGLAVWRAVAPEAADSQPSDNAGFSNIEVLAATGLGTTALALLFALLILALSGCPSVITTNAKHSASIDFDSALCSAVITADGKAVFVLNSDPAVKCLVKCSATND